MPKPGDDEGVRRDDGGPVLSHMGLGFASVLWPIGLIAGAFGLVFVWMLFQEGFDIQQAWAATLAFVEGISNRD